MKILEETSAEREVSKPAVLGAPYDLSSVSSEGQEELRKSFFEEKSGAEPQTAEEVGVTADDLFGLKEPSIEQVLGQILRGFETLQDNLAKMFKQMGHGDEWNRIINS